MNPTIHRSRLRLLLHSPNPLPHLLRLISGDNHRPVLSRTLPHRFLSNHIDHEEVGTVTDPFASLKCHTCLDDPHLPYYVIDGARRPRRSSLVAVEGAQKLEGRSVEQLRCGACDVVLVGVRQGDQNSSEELKNVINHLKPDVVFLELCKHRQAVLQNFQDNETNKVRNIMFHTVFETAVQNDAKVILGDRPFHITVQRILESMLSMRVWEFTKLSFFLLVRFMEYGKENKVFNINDFVFKKLEELKTFPTLLQPIIYERDLYMSSVLAKISKDHSLVVAIIGLDHVDGIKERLKGSPFKPTLAFPTSKCG